MQEVEVPADGSERETGWLRRLMAPAIGPRALRIVLVLLHGLSHGIDYHAMRAMRRTSNRLLLWSAGATAVSYVALIARDMCALRYVGARIPASALLLGSFCGSALGNAVGFGALTGGAVRYRAYGTVGVSSEQITRSCCSSPRASASGSRPMPRGRPVRRPGDRPAAASLA